MDINSLTHFFQIIKEETEASIADNEDVIRIQGNRILNTGRDLDSETNSAMRLLVDKVGPLSQRAEHHKRIVRVSQHVVDACDYAIDATNNDSALLAFFEHMLGKIATELLLDSENTVQIVNVWRDQIACAHIDGLRANN